MSVRVVLDTNVWVSGLLWTGPCWRIVRQAEQGLIRPCMTPVMLQELAAVLAQPRLASRLRGLGLAVDEIISFVAHVSDLYDEPDPFSSPLVVADPDDDVFIRCAEQAEALFVISGDQHLLAMEGHASVKILSAREFLESDKQAPGMALST